jgi:hypothetical protein
VSEHNSQQHSETLIPVRVTSTASTLDTYQEADAELQAAMERGGLVFSRTDPNFPRWFATQRELDTPHTTFRLSPR